jgi:hypothetical protein
MMQKKKISYYSKIKGKKYILLNILICFCFCILSCSIHIGNPAADLKPEIIKNIAGVRKNVVSRESIKDSEIYRMAGPDKEYGYTGESGKKFIQKGGYPNSFISRLDDKGNVIWTKSTEGWPSNNPGSILTYESGGERIVMVLLHGKNSEFLVYLSENGDTKKIVPLIGSEEKQFFHIRTFSFKGKDYILADGFFDTMIYDFDGRLIAALKTPIITGRVAVAEINAGNGSKYLGLYVDHRLPTRSATIFILSEKMEIVYQEVVTGRRGLWIGKQAAAVGEDLIIVTYEDPKDAVSQKDFCCEDPLLRYVYWRYSIKGK